MRATRIFSSGSFTVAALLLLACCSGALGQGEGLEVRSIEVTSGMPVSVEHVKSRMATKVGDPLSEKTLDLDVKRLYRAGYICTGIERRVDGDKVALKLHVDAQTVIAAIILEGNHRMRTRKLTENMGIEEGRATGIHYIKKEENRLQEMYRQAGFHFAAVDSDLRATEGRTDLIFNIKEGPRVRVTTISIEGNTAFPLKKLLKIVRTKHHIWWRPGYCVYEQIETDIDMLSRFHRSQGWLDANVEAVTEFTRGNTRVNVKFVISEGVLYKAGKIRILGNKLFSTEEILSKTKLREGAAFNIPKLVADADAIQVLYEAKGYMLTSVMVKRKIREKEPVVDIDYEIKEGMKTRIERIDIVGNERTRDEVIRRELTFLPGETFDVRKVRKSKGRLLQTGFFEKVDVIYEKGSAPDLTEMKIAVKEKKTGQLRLSVAGFEGIVGFIDIIQNNFDYRKWPRSWKEFLSGKSFVGDGQRLRLRVMSGSGRTDYLVDFLEPWVFNRPISFGLGASAGSHEYSQYDTDIVSGYVSLGRRIGEDARIKLTYRQKSIDLHNVDPAVLPTVTDELGKNLLSSLELSSTIDKRDSSRYPTSGYKLRLGYEYVGGSLGGGLDFHKVFGRMDWYTGLFETSLGKHVLKLSAEARWAEEFSDTASVPIYQRYYAGGIRTVRGYESRSLGPRLNDEAIGGNLRVLMNAEYVFPMYENFLFGCLFHDVGEVWEDRDEFDWGDIKRSVGVGVLFKMPFPIEFYYGWVLDDVPGEPSGQFHFALGYWF